MVGLDVHTKGIRTLAILLRERGVEVVYAGEHNSPAGIVAAAIAEDVDAIGLSFSTAGYLHHVECVVGARRDAGADHIAVMVGGLIHPDDVDRLVEIGVDASFGPESGPDEVVTFLRLLVDGRVTT